MDNLIVWKGIFLTSIIWGVIHYKAGYYVDIERHNKYFKFLEFLRSCINYFICLIVAYYIISIRWPYIRDGNGLSVADLILGAIFLGGAFGWLPYFVKNITEGVNVIFTRLLNK